MLDSDFLAPLCAFLLLLCLVLTAGNCSSCGGDTSFLLNHVTCPECSTCYESKLLSSRPFFCRGCGFEFIHRCECGRVCDTPFCESCGAEQ